MRRFAAPWGSRLRLSSGIFVAVVSVPTIYQLSFGRPIGVLLLAAAVVPLCFMVRGYAVTGTHLEVLRLGWTTRWPLEGLRSARVEPNAIARSVGRLANNGVYAVTGEFTNARLGRYRAFVTDADRTVVLRFDDGILVVSPDDPAGFVEALNRR